MSAISVTDQEGNKTLQTRHDPMNFSYCYLLYCSFRKECFCTDFISSSSIFQDCYCSSLIEGLFLKDLKKNCLMLPHGGGTFQVRNLFNQCLSFSICQCILSFVVLDVISSFYLSVYIVICGAWCYWVFVFFYLSVYIVICGAWCYWHSICQCILSFVVLDVIVSVYIVICGAWCYWQIFMSLRFLIFL